MSARRVPELDALRGLAAAAVVVCHCLPAGVPGPDYKWVTDFTPFGLLQDGRASVILFFVLSGYALSLSMLGEARPRWSGFALRRVVRIWPAFAVAVVLAAALCTVVDTTPVPGMSGSFNLLWSPGLPSWAHLGSTLLMLGRREDSLLDNPVWSLTHELRLSVLLPLLFAAQLRANIAVMAGSIAMSFAVAVAVGAFPGYHIPWYGETVAASFFATAYYAMFFTFGIALARHGPGALGRLSRPALWVMVAIVFSVRWPSRFVTDLLDGAAGTALIWLCTTSRLAGAVLRSRGLQLLGRLSYSLYLVHVIVLLTVVHALGGMLPLWLLLVAVPPLSLLAAWALHAGVEAPSIAWSRRVGRTRPVLRKESPA